MAHKSKDEHNVNITATSFWDKSLAGKVQHIAQDPHKAVRKTAYHALSLVGSRDFVPFVVLTRDRTGSNMLIQALDAHPHIAADYEIFGRLRGRREADILARAYGRQPFYIRAKGFKIFYYHPQDAPGSPVWDMLAAVERLHVIHLRRRNILHALVSSRLAYQTGIYGVRSAKEAAKFGNSLPTVSFTAEELERDFQQTRTWEREGIARFEGRPTLDVTYEDMTADLPGQFTRITDFLGVVPRPPHTDFKKQRTRSLRETVENFDSLLEHFRGTEWEVLFDEQ
jgi:LPS sulfotransferase NodH